jgi:hypothetical protein
MDRTAIRSISVCPYRRDVHQARPGKIHSAWCTSRARNQPLTGQTGRILSPCRRVGARSAAHPSRPPHPALPTGGRTCQACGGRGGCASLGVSMRREGRPPAGARTPAAQAPPEAPTPASAPRTTRTRTTTAASSRPTAGVDLSGKPATVSRAPGFHAVAPGHRVDQRNLHGPTRPRTPRWSHPRKRVSPGAPAGSHHRDLAQRPHRPTSPALTHRPRPLTTSELII